MFFFVLYTLQENVYIWELEDQYWLSNAWTGGHDWQVSVN